MNRIIIIYVILIILLIYFIYYCNEKFTNIPIQNNKILIIYAYYKDTNNNFNFFLKNGITNNPNHEFVVIHHIDSDNEPELKTLGKNIKVIRKKNIGFDFGAWGHYIHSIPYNNYDYFIFINTSVRGPFIPRWCSKMYNWADLMVSSINENIKLVGPTINYMFNPHIQSMAWATDKIGLKLLIDKNILVPNLQFTNIQDVIVNHEVKMSKVILDAGYDIFAFQISEEVNQSKHRSNIKIHDDIHFENQYYSLTINPFEVMFVKTNFDKVLKKYRVNDKYVKFYTKILFDNKI